MKIDLITNGEIILAGRNKEDFRQCINVASKMVELDQGHLKLVNASACATGLYVHLCCEWEYFRAAELRELYAIAKEIILQEEGRHKIDGSILIIDQHNQDKGHYIQVKNGKVFYNQAIKTTGRRVKIQKPGIVHKGNIWTLFYDNEEVTTKEQHGYKAYIREGLEKLGYSPDLV